MNKLVVLALSVFGATCAFAQTCDNSDVSKKIFNIISTDNQGFIDEITTAGDAVVDVNGVTLTSTSAASYGGFFFNGATAFQGDGGFSAKFAIQAGAGTGGGEAWEFIVADSGSRQFQPPPYSPGSANNGLSGWSRQNAMVIEFDSLNSGATEQDSSNNHISMFVGGAQVCEVTSSISFSDGNLYYVWVDFIGLQTTMEVRVSAANTDTRPTSATVACGVDMWSTLNINAANHIGFGAYNPSGASGAQHNLREIISITDAYRPEDLQDTSGECSYFTDCALRSTNSLCTTFLGNGQCTFETCPPTYVWTVGGGSCCAFVEKSSYRATGPAADIVNGGTTTCARTRVTVVYPTDASACSSGAVPTTIAATTATTVAATTVATTIATAAPDEDF